jgi:hypothetical protein
MNVINDRLSIGWPTEAPSEPDRAKDLKPGWFTKRHENFFHFLVRPGMTLVEVGAWLGQSTRWFADKAAPAGIHARVYAVDTWHGSIEHYAEHDDLEEILWPTFVARSWSFKNTIVPVRAKSIVGLPHLANVMGVVPDLVYIDGSHLYQDVLVDVLLCAGFWPKTVLTGDDLRWPSVKKAVEDACDILKTSLVEDVDCWMIQR